ncbi:glycosyltransferase [Dokdonella sp.]|uniref:glycosyltransferase n=1 Tax=Dokdonella sp. TaxID=2291710 RepID=UPI0035284160
MRGAALIVLAWNKWELTRRCLDTLLESDLQQAEIIVVDNGSEDETVLALDSYSDEVRIVRLPENLGFVRGMNAGIDAARSEDDVVLLNNDLVITQHDWLNRLRDAAYASAENGIVGCRMLGAEPENLLFHLGGFIEPDRLWGQQTESGQQETDVGQFPRTRRAQCVAFALAYIRRDCLQRIGTLDEIFHSYYEDTDYCLRAAEQGIASVVAGAVTLRHDQHGSTRDDGGFRERLWKQSRESFAARWRDRLTDRYRGTVLWQGLTRFPHAYAQLTHGLLWRLDARCMRMAFAETAPELLDGGDFRLELAAERSLPPLPEVALVCAPGQMLAAARGQFRVALGYCEWQQPPASWVEHSKGFDLLLVPDAFQAGAYRDAGVRTPIEIVPLGIDREYCHPDVPRQRGPRERFVFLCVAEELQRDAPGQVIAAFRNSFNAKDPVELVVYVCPGHDESVIRDALEPLVKAPGKARVRLLAGWGFPAYERAQLMMSADAYVSARRGAGWDPFAREAIACGRILVAPAYGSQRELVREWGHAVEQEGYSEDPAQPGCLWSESDRESLAWNMREVYGRQEELGSLALSNASRFASAHNLDLSADLLVRKLESGSTLKPAAALVAPHQPRTLDLTGSGQIVVLGMHRSGTSSVGGILNLLGAWPGPDELLLRGEDNPRGHYEHGELHMACLRRLQAAGGDWKQPPVNDPPVAAVDAFRAESAAVLETLEPRRPWFIKEPRLCLLVRELLPLLTRPVFVHVVRDPREVADSLRRRDNMPAIDALALWERYTRAAFAASFGWHRLIIDYNALLEDPLESTRALLDDLEAAGIEGLRMPAAETIRNWIEPERTRQPVEGITLDDSQSELLASIRDRSILESAAAEC